MATRTSGFQNFVYSGGTFTTLPADGSVSVVAFGVNDSGTVVGYGTSGGSTHGYVYSGGAYTQLDAPGATFTAAYGINDAGDVVGGYNDSSGSHGFIDSGGTFTTLDFPAPPSPGPTASTPRAT